EVGMGENILILAFVVIVIGGIGSIRGAFAGALVVGIVDTLGRTLLPMSLRVALPPQMAANLGPSLASILIYVLMAAVLFWRRQGLFPARGGCCRGDELPGERPGFFAEGIIAGCWTSVSWRAVDRLYACAQCALGRFALMGSLLEHPLHWKIALAGLV